MSEGIGMNAIPVAINYGFEDGLSAEESESSGDCFILPISATECVLLDSGLSAAAENIKKYIGAKKMSIVGVILSHFDGDHIGGFLKLCEDIDETKAKNQNTPQWKRNDILRHVEWVVCPSIDKNIKQNDVGKEEKGKQNEVVEQKGGQQNEPAEQKKVEKRNTERAEKGITSSLCLKASGLTQCSHIASYIYAMTNGRVLISKYFNSDTTDIRAFAYYEQLNLFVLPPPDPNTNTESRVEDIPLLKTIKGMETYKPRPVGATSVSGTRNKKTERNDNWIGNYSSIITCYIGEKEEQKGEKKKEQKIYHYQFTADSIATLVFAEMHNLPFNNEIMRKICEYGSVYTEVRDVMGELWKAAGMKGDMHRQRLQLLGVFEKLFIKEDSRISIILRGQFKRNERWDMFQLPHHGSVSNAYVVGDDKRTCYIDTQDVDVFPFRSCKGIFCTGAGTLYHCDALLLQNVYRYAVRHNPYAVIYLGKKYIDETKNTRGDIESLNTSNNTNNEANSTPVDIQYHTVLTSLADLFRVKYMFNSQTPTSSIDIELQPYSEDPHCTSAYVQSAIEKMKECKESSAAPTSANTDTTDLVKGKAKAILIKNASKYWAEEYLDLLKKWNGAYLLIRQRMASREPPSQSDLLDIYQRCHLQKERVKYVPILQVHQQKLPGIVDILEKLDEPENLDNETVQPIKRKDGSYLLRYKMQCDVMTQDYNELLQKQKELVEKLCPNEQAVQSDDIYLLFAPEVTESTYVEMLVQACKHGHVELSKDLMENITDVNAYAEDGAAPLHAAAMSGTSQLVYDLLARGADINLPHLKKKSTALYFALEVGSRRIVKWIMKLQPKVDTVNINGNAPIHAMAYLDNLDAIQKQVRRGADLNQTSKGDTILHIAVWSENYALVEKQIELGVDVNRKASNGQTPLHLAIEIKHLEIMKLLLANGARTDIPNRYAYRALHECIMTKPNAVTISMIKLLIQYGADPRAATANSKPKTSIDQALTLKKPGVDFHLDQIQALLTYEKWEWLHNFITDINAILPPNYQQVQKEWRASCTEELFKSCLEEITKGVSIGFNRSHVVLIVCVQTSKSSEERSNSDTPHTEMISQMIEWMKSVSNRICPLIVEHVVYNNFFECLFKKSNIDLSLKISEAFNSRDNTMNVSSELKKKVKEEPKKNLTKYPPQQNKNGNTKYHRFALDGSLESEMTGKTMWDLQKQSDVLGIRNLQGKTVLHLLCEGGEDNNNIIKKQCDLNLSEIGQYTEDQSGLTPLHVCKHFESTANILLEASIRDNMHNTLRNWSNCNTSYDMLLLERTIQNSKKELLETSIEKSKNVSLETSIKNINEELLEATIKNSKNVLHHKTSIEKSTKELLEASIKNSMNILRLETSKENINEELLEATIKNSKNVLHHKTSIEKSTKELLEASIKNSMNILRLETSKENIKKELLETIYSNNVLDLETSKESIKKALDLKTSKENIKKALDLETRIENIKKELLETSIKNSKNISLLEASKENSNEELLKAIIKNSEDILRLEEDIETTKKQLLKASIENSKNVLLEASMTRLDQLHFKHDQCYFIAHSLVYKYPQQLLALDLRGQNGCMGRKDKNGYTPQMLAVRQHNDKLVKKLVTLCSQADLKVCNHEGYNALEVACQNYLNIDILETLYDETYGKDNASSPDNINFLALALSTALHLQDAYNSTDESTHIESIKYLIEKAEIVVTSQVKNKNVLKFNPYVVAFDKRASKDILTALIKAKELEKCYLKTGNEYGATSLSKAIDTLRKTDFKYALELLLPYYDLDSWEISGKLAICEMNKRQERMSKYYPFWQTIDSAYHLNMIYEISMNIQSEHVKSPEQEAARLLQCLSNIAYFQSYGTRKINSMKRAHQDWKKRILKKHNEIIVEMKKQVEKSQLSASEQHSLRDEIATQNRSLEEFCNQNIENTEKIRELCANYSYAPLFQQLYFAPTLSDKMLTHTMMPPLQEEIMSLYNKAYIGTPVITLTIEIQTEEAIALKILHYI